MRTRTPREIDRFWHGAHLHRGQQMLQRWRWTLQGRAYPCRNPQYFSIYKVRIENIRKRGQP